MCANKAGERQAPAYKELENRSPRESLALEALGARLFRPRGFDVEPRHQLLCHYVRASDLQALVAVVAVHTVVMMMMATIARRARLHRARYRT